MKLRRILVLAGMCIGIMAMPVGAKTSQLDVKAGDICSYYTYKDTGSAYENYYYVTPTTYVGKYIMGNSISKNGKYSSGYTLLYRSASKYSYGLSEVPGGMYYRLETGPAADTGAGWHLKGRYTP